MSSDIALAPQYILEMIKSKSTVRMLCCPFFCACGGDPTVCNNPFKWQTNTDETDENTDNDDIPQQ